MISSRFSSRNERKPATPSRFCSQQTPFSTYDMKSWESTPPKALSFTISIIASLSKRISARFASCRRHSTGTCAQTWWHGRSAPLRFFRHCCASKLVNIVRDAAVHRASTMRLDGTWNVAFQPHPEAIKLRAKALTTTLSSPKRPHTCVLTSTASTTRCPACAHTFQHHDKQPTTLLPPSHTVYHLCTTCETC